MKETEQKKLSSKRENIVRKKIYDVAGGGEHGVSRYSVSFSTHSGFTRALGFEEKPGLFESGHILPLLKNIGVVPWYNDV